MSLSRARIKDLGIITTGKTPSTDKPEFFDGDYPFITPSDYDHKSFYCRKTERTVTDVAKSKHNNQFVFPNSILVTCIGATIGKTCLSPSAALINQQINAITTNKDYDSKYVYYLMIHNYEKIRGIGLGGGAATPLLNKTTFENIELNVHELSEQKKIGAFLFCYDELIEKNNQQIAHLEEAARLIYREWFVHLRFPGYEKVKFVNGVPEDWEKNGKIGDLASVLSGYAFKSKDWLTEGNPVIKIKNITEYGTVNIDICDCVNDLVASNVQRFEVFEGDLLIAMTGATVGKVGTVPFLSTRHFLNQRVGKFIAKNENCKNFIFSFCRSNAFQVAVSNLAGGAAQPNISAKQIESIKCVIPPADLLKKYNDLTNPMKELRGKLIKQNKFLMEGRDVLLPRLMNGDIEL